MHFQVFLPGHCAVVHMYRYHKIPAITTLYLRLIQHPPFTPFHPLHPWGLFFVKLILFFSVSVYYCILTIFVWKKFAIRWSISRRKNERSWSERPPAPNSWKCLCWMETTSALRHLKVVCVCRAENRLSNTRLWGAMRWWPTYSKC